MASLDSHCLHAWKVIFMILRLLNNILSLFNNLIRLATKILR